MDDTTSEPPQPPDASAGDVEEVKRLLRKIDYRSGDVRHEAGEELYRLFVRQSEQIASLTKERDEARRWRDTHRDKRNIARKAAKDNHKGLEHWKSRAEAAEQEKLTLEERLSELEQEAVKVVEELLAAFDGARMVERGAGGMTIDAQIKRSVYNGVPAWPVEEARAFLDKHRRPS